MLSRRLIRRGESEINLDYASLMLAKAGSEGARHPRDARHNGGIAGKKVGGSLPWATDVLRFSWHVAFPAAY